jgi:4'-phosphopantetheinyl transferase
MHCVDMNRFETFSMPDLLATPPLFLPEITVYLLSRSSASRQIGHLAEMLSDAELTRAHSMKNDRRRSDFIIGRAALADIIAQNLNGGCSIREWRRTFSPTGKPGLKSPGNKQGFFSLSYSEDLIGIGVSTVDEIGIDLEAARTISPGDFPDTLLSAGETRLLAATEAQEKSRVFLKIWTMKEAVAKADGMGLAADLSTIDTVTFLESTDTASGLFGPSPARTVFHTEVSMQETPYFLSVAAGAPASAR